MLGASGLGSTKRRSIRTMLPVMVVCARAGRKSQVIDNWFTIEMVDGVMVLALRGAQDVAGEAPLRRASADLIDSHLPIVVDLDLATYVDTAALGVLLNLRRAAREADIECRFVLPRDERNPVVRVLQIAQLDTVLPIDGTLPEAVAAVRGRALPPAPR